MIVCHTHKFIVLKSVRTGSNAFNIAIRNSGLIDEETDYVSRLKFLNMPHIGKSSDACWGIPELIRSDIITQDQVDTYVIYVVYRNPVDRFISTCNLIKREPSEHIYYESILNKSIEDITYDDIISSAGCMSYGIFRTQSSRLNIDNINVIDYNNLSESIASIITKYGGTVDIPVVNQSTVRMTGDITPELIAKIEAHYSEDMLIEPNFIL
jgi:hypothetical protein